MMRAFLSSVAVIAVGVVGSVAVASERKPNILILLADDLGFSDLGCYGSEIATPNLDRLAVGGLRFGQFYNTGRCWPTRSALLSGYYPQQIGMDPPTMQPSPAWVRTLPQHLRAAGYRSYHSGKWHFFGRARPVEDGGFDRSAAVGHDNNYFERLPGRKDAPAGFYSTTAITDHALECLREHQRRYAAAPFFSYVAYFAPHFPVQAPAQDIAAVKGRYDAGWDAIRQRRWERLKQWGVISHDLPPRDERLSPRYWQPDVMEKLGPGELRHAVAWNSLNAEQRRFQAAKMEVHAAMVERMDREVGRLIDHLRTTGTLDNTLVCFLSDNGADSTIMVRGGGHDRQAPAGSAATFLCLGPGWASACNSPFRRHKVWTHEGGVSTPLIVHWPQGIAARGEWRQTVGHVIDLVPTLLEVAGIPPALSRGAPELPGRSLIAALAKDGIDARDCLFFHHEGNRALRVGDYKLVSASEDGDRWELFDLARDRGEQHDLAPRQPDRVQALAARWQQLQEQFVASFNRKP